MEDARARKERLKALKQAAQLMGEGNDAAHRAAAAPEPQPAPEPEPEKPLLKFRNYQVKDKKIEHEVVAPAIVPELAVPVIESRPEDADQEELLANVVPKKANWDLKRDLQPKLDKLERRTQRALIEIMQEEERRRLQEEGIQD